ITATDAGGLSITRPFTITVLNVNEAPTAIALSNASVSENAAGASIGTLSATDPDANDAATFTVSDNRFEVVGNTLKLKAGVSLDYEATPAVGLNITATDAGGLPLTRPFTIFVLNANEAPTAEALSGGTVPEQTAGAPVGTLSAT